MKFWLPRCTLVASLAAALMLAQIPPQEDAKLPSGKSQRDEILKSEHQQNVKDAAQLVELAQQLQQEIEKNDRFVLSLASIKKTEEIEKVAKRIRTRMGR
jgi:hypothetical protein